MQNEGYTILARDRNKVKHKYIILKIRVQRYKNFTADSEISPRTPRQISIHSNSQDYPTTKIWKRTPSKVEYGSQLLHTFRNELPGIIYSLYK